MARDGLSSEVKVFIVQAVACFDSPTTVAEGVNREFGVKIPRQQVEKYDPTKRAGRNLSEKLKAIFEATRTAFIDDTASIGWSHRSARLRLIQRVGEKAENMGNMVIALQAAEQAAKEMGGIYTNRQKVDHTSSDGTMSPKAAAFDLATMSDDEIEAYRTLAAAAARNRKGD